MKLKISLDLLQIKMKVKVLLSAFCYLHRFNESWKLPEL